MLAYRNRQATQIPVPKGLPRHEAICFVSPNGTRSPIRRHVSRPASWRSQPDRWELVPVGAQVSRAPPAQIRTFRIAAYGSYLVKRKTRRGFIVDSPTVSWERSGR
jgi:hypothetical protein